jgi:hypothetical protein
MTDILMKTNNMADIGPWSFLNHDELVKSEFFRIAVIPAEEDMSQ